jgi:hypothetical protein
MVGPALGGLTLARLGSTAMWLSAASLAVVASGVFLALRPALRRRQAEGDGGSP